MSPAARNAPGTFSDRANELPNSKERRADLAKPWVALLVINDHRPIPPSTIYPSSDCLGNDNHDGETLSILELLLRMTLRRDVLDQDRVSKPRCRMPEPDTNS